MVVLGHTWIDTPRKEKEYTLGSKLYESRTSQSCGQLARENGLMLQN